MNVMTTTTVRYSLKKDDKFLITADVSDNSFHADVQFYMVYDTMDATEIREIADMLLTVADRLDEDE